MTITTVTPDVGGTGLNTLATNRIPYGNGTGALNSSSTFVFDGTNLGVGTASPAAKLDVNGTAKANSVSLNGVAIGDYLLYQGLATQVGSGYGIGINSANSTDNAYIYFGYGTTVPQQQSAAIGRIGGDVLGLFTAGTERVRITSAGGVSFGATGTAYGTSGQVLTSAGNAPPTWTTIASGGNYVMNVYTSNTTWSKPAGLKAIKVTCVGGGGSGGGSSNIRSAGAGGGGGTAILYLTAASVSSSYSLTIGSGGSAVSGFSAGNGGGTSSFGAACSATGGSGGAGNNNNASDAPAGGAGGVGSSGTINIAGGGGGSGAGQTNYGTAQGGSSFLGGGAAAQAYNTGGNTGGQYGGGGSGANSTSSSGAGYQGVIIVEEFY